MVGFDQNWHKRNDERLARLPHIERKLDDVLAYLRGLTQGEERIMSQQDDLNAAAAQEEQDIASIQASQASYAASSAAMLAELQSLQQAQQQGQPIDLTNALKVAQDLHQAAQSLSGAASTEASQAAAATGTGTPTTPTDPGTTTTPTDPGTTTTPTDPGTGTTTAPTDTSQLSQAVYTFSDPNNPGSTAPAGDPAWTLAPFTTSDGQPLYYFASDVASTDPSVPPVANGDNVGGVWHVYNGALSSEGSTSTSDSGSTTDTPTSEPTPGDTTGGASPTS